jgi:hypothetical protein
MFYNTSPHKNSISNIKKVKYNVLKKVKKFSSEHLFRHYINIRYTIKQLKKKGN